MPVPFVRTCSFSLPRCLLFLGSRNSPDLLLPVLINEDLVRGRVKMDILGQDGNVLCVSKDLRHLFQRNAFRLRNEEVHTNSTQPRNDDEQKVELPPYFMLAVFHLAFKALTNICEGCCCCL